MTAAYRSEIPMHDATAPLRRGVFRARRMSDEPHHVQIQLEVPRQEVSPPYVIHIDDLFALVRSLCPDLQLNVDVIASPSLLMSAMSAAQPIREQPEGEEETS